MNKLMLGIGAVAMLAGCATMSSEDPRTAYQKEFERLSSLPSAESVASPNKNVRDCGVLCSALFNDVQLLMKAYVAKVETCREYTGFMNEVQYYVKEEKMSESNACDKVWADVLAKDATKAEDEKVEQKIKRGIKAAEELDPKNQLARIGELTLRSQRIDKDLKGLPKAYEKEDFMGKAMRGKECAAISKQLAEATECLVFLGDQYSRVLQLENYAR